MPKRSRSNSAALIEGGLSAPPAKRFAYSSPPPSTRRSDSAAPSGCSLPLTYENIGAVPGFPPLSWRKAPSDRASSELPSEAEAKAETCGPIISRSGSPTRKNWDESTKLAAFNTKVDSDQPYPADLQRHVDTVLLAHIPGPRSPNAHRICDQRKAAALQNEPGANTILRPWLLFEGELPSATQPVPRIASQANLNLARDFLPRPPKPIVQVVYGALSQPQPDTAIGYLTPTEANASTPPLATAFSHDEQLILTNYTPAQPYTLDQRLNSLKDALPQFYQEYWKEAKPKTKQSRSNNAYSRSDSSASASIQSSVLVAPAIPALGTQPIMQAQPRKKRKKTDEACASEDESNGANG